jgi:ABC-type amino acid transport substrate-binding protein
MVDDRRLMVFRRLMAGVVAVVLMVGAGCGASSRTGSTGSFKPAHSHTLTVATAFLSAPGFWEGELPAPSGGFERDLAHALAQRFGLASVAVVPVAFGDLVGGHLGGADLALSELTPTAERERVLAFSTPYLVAPPGVVVRPGTATPDLAALRKLRWVAVTGSTLTRLVKDVIRPDHTALEVPGRPEALQAIDGGRADAMLLDLPVGLALGKAMPDRYRVTAQLSGSEGLAAALPRGSKNFDAVDSAIRAFLADGTIDRLSKRWLGEKLGSGADSIPLIRTEG